MTTPPRPERVQYALTSVYTDQYIGGEMGPALITADPILAARFFLDHDRWEQLDVMVRSASADGTLTPCHPGELIRQARAAMKEMGQNEALRHWGTLGDGGAEAMLERAQTEWLKDRLFYKNDPTAQDFDNPTEVGWDRAGQLWAAAFGDVPSNGVLTRLRAEFPNGGVGYLVTSAAACARAIRQARGEAGEGKRQQLADNYATLHFAWDASQTPAAKAAMHWYLDRLADLDPDTATPPQDLPPDGLQQWRRAVRDYQRDQVVLNPEFRRPLADYLEAVLQQPAPATVADPARDAPDAAAVPGRLPPAPVSDEDAALAWRRASPDAQRSAEEDDQMLGQAHAYVTHAKQRAEEGEPVAESGTTVPATEIVRETMARHVVLGHLLALFDAEQAAEKLRPLVHDAKAQDIAERAREEALEAGKKPGEAAQAATAAYVAHVDAYERAIDEVLEERRRMVRVVAAAQAPFQQGRPLLNSLAQDLDRQIRTLPAQAQRANRARRTAAEDLQRELNGPLHIGAPVVRQEQVDQANAEAKAAYQRWDELLTHDVPAMNRALRALRRVVAQQGPLPRPPDGLDILRAHEQALTDRLHAQRHDPGQPAPAAGQATRRPTAAPAQQTTRRPAPAQRGMR